VGQQFSWEPGVEYIKITKLAVIRAAGGRGSSLHYCIWDYLFTSSKQSYQVIAVLGVLVSIIHKYDSIVVSHHPENIVGWWDDKMGISHTEFL